MNRCIECDKRSLVRFKVRKAVEKASVWMGYVLVLGFLVVVLTIFGFSDKVSMLRFLGTILTSLLLIQTTIEMSRELRK